MKCNHCHGELETIVGSYLFKTHNLGVLSVPDIDYEQCNSCGETLLNAEQAEYVYEYAKKVEQERISVLPVCEFVSLVQAAELLHITKQAFSKDKRVKRGMVYSIKVAGRTLYHGPSVLAYGETRDGRIPLEEEKRESMSADTYTITEVHLVAPTTVEKARISTINDFYVRSDHYMNGIEESAGHRTVPRVLVMDAAKRSENHYNG